MGAYFFFAPKFATRDFVFFYPAFFLASGTSRMSQRAAPGPASAAREPPRPERSQPAQGGRAREGTEAPDPAEASQRQAADQEPGPESGSPQTKSCLEQDLAKGPPSGEAAEDLAHVTEGRPRPRQRGPRTSQAREEPARPGGAYSRGPAEEIPKQ